VFVGSVRFMDSAEVAGFEEIAGSVRFMDSAEVAGFEEIAGSVIISYSEAFGDSLR